MGLDRSFVEQNRASTQRMRMLAARLSDAEFQQRVGEHWTAAAAFAHIAFWDRRTLDILEQTERAGHLVVPEIDQSVNDLALPLWNAIPGRAAAQIAAEAAGALDRRLEGFPEPLLQEIYNQRPRWVLRALHRDEHLDEVEAALKTGRG